MNEPVDKFLGLTKSASASLVSLRGGGPSLMHAANAIAAFDEFSRAAATKPA
jgi:hypothetical protein